MNPEQRDKPGLSEEASEIELCEQDLLELSSGTALQEAIPSAQASKAQATSQENANSSHPAEMATRKKWAELRASALAGTPPKELTAQDLLDLLGLSSPGSSEEPKVASQRSVPEASPRERTIVISGPPPNLLDSQTAPKRPVEDRRS